MKGNSFHVPSSYSRVIARELQLQERDLSRFLAGTGLSSHILQPEDDSTISAEQQLRILDNVLALQGAETAGLRVGAALEPAAHGPLGFLALSSATPRKGLESLRDFLPTRIPFTAITLRDEGRYLVCEQQLLIDTTPAQKRMVHEAFTVIVQQLVEAVLGEEMRGALFYLPFEKPSHHRVYGDFLHGRVVFSASSARVRIPLRVIDLPNAGGDEATYEHTRQLCEQLLAETAEGNLTTRGRVRQLLLERPPGSLSEEQVARYLFISKRTLARRLAAEESSYRALRDEIWADLAANQLLHSSLKVESVAHLLGYSDAAAFRKAFRRWYGESPSSYREHRRA